MCINNNDIVAHYTKLKYFEEILNRKTIVLGTVSKFDDPRESSMSWISSVCIGDKIDPKVIYIMEKLKKDAGSKISVFCTCMQNNEIENTCPIESSIYGKPRMWSQYGDQSKGFCVMFEKKALHNKIQSLAQNHKYLIADKITYLEWLNIIGGGITIEYGQNVNLPEEITFDILNRNNMLHSVYFKKSIDWRDECEYRWLLFSDEIEEKKISIENCIKSIVLGCNFPKDLYKKAIDYCNILHCSCYALIYGYPKYTIFKIN